MKCCFLSDHALPKIHKNVERCLIVQLGLEAHKVRASQMPVPRPSSVSVPVSIAQEFNFQSRSLYGSHSENYYNGQNMRVVLTAWIFNKLDILEASFFLYRSVKL